ncbi:SspB family protein [Propylenella binzhouense]|uniref:Stringent starvation protein B n=1 Tax=Propylenella binzhouense TaxID=2555902 RepID=A0A964T7J4_9HYPH|nr:ClpXP protease specificity-enhancing factor SspB [Propylenella binzhouense]MYZ49973.1 hypothetical protein [Propylenella binzhouense]
MAQDLIRYDVLAQDALRGVVRKVLSEVAQTGLPGEHHFFITFNTGDPGVRVSSRLHEKYPNEMTIVLQHQFWDLAVGDTAFDVGLSFNGIPERLHVPFRAIVAFVDPHASFGLKFDAQTSAEAEPAEEPPAPEAGPQTGAGEVPAPDAAPGAGADVVSLDSFRKKNS